LGGSRSQQEKVSIYCPLVYGRGSPEGIYKREDLQQERCDVGGGGGDKVNEKPCVEMVTI